MAGRGASWQVGECHGRYSVEHVRRIWLRDGEHVRDDGRVRCEDTLVHATDVVADADDEVPIWEPKAFNLVLPFAHQESKRTRKSRKRGRHWTEGIKR